MGYICVRAGATTCGHGECRKNRRDEKGGNKSATASASGRLCFPTTTLQAHFSPPLPRVRGRCGAGASAGGAGPTIGGSLLCLRRHRRPLAPTVAHATIILFCSEPPPCRGYCHRSRGQRYLGGSFPYNQQRLPCSWRGRVRYCRRSWLQRPPKCGRNRRGEDAEGRRRSKLEQCIIICDSGCTSRKGRGAQPPPRAPLVAPAAVVC